MSGIFHPAALRGIRSSPGGGIFNPGNVAVDISNTASAVDATDLTNYTFASQSVGAAVTGRIIVVGVAARSSTAGRTISSVTLAGNAMSHVVTATNADSGTNICALYALQVDVGTTASVVVNFSGSMIRAGICVWRMTGAASAAAHATDSDITVASGVLSGAGINVPAAGGAIGIAYHVASATFGWTNLTEDADVMLEGSFNAMSGASAEFAAAQTGLIVTATGSDTTSSVNASLALASWGP